MCCTSSNQSWYGQSHNELVCLLGHSIHSSGQIEWYTNTVDDKSVQVGGQQRINTIDGYSMPLLCKGGLMYLELQGIRKTRFTNISFCSPHKSS